MKAMRIHGNGAPDAFRCDEVELPPPGPGQARIRHGAIALNFSDVNVRRGGFYLATPLRFPVTLGNEAAGVVVAVGEGVRSVKEGDRVAYVGSGGPFYENTGAYAEERNLPSHVLVKLPESISERTAAALMLKGLTASLVINRCHRPARGESILIHAAASGVGLLLVQWTKHLGATVIGTVGSADKAQTIRSYGADHAILYREADFVAEARKLAPEGVAAVFDGVGRDTFHKSLDVIRPFGMLVNYGNASGHPDPVDLLLLAKKGSIFVSRPAISSHIARLEDLRRYSNELFDLVGRGVLKVEIGRSYRLEDVAQAHRDIEARNFAGSAVLIP